MFCLHAKSALLKEGWRADVRLTVVDGMIQTVETGVPRAAGDDGHGIIVPGLGNLHSHAFQRGMAGLAEIRGPASDSFWSWRKVMYDFALSVSPDNVEAIAAQLYMEMLEAGFTRVGEFHYLHHDVDGRPYGQVSELAQRIAAAAGETGIALTLLPVFYAHAGFGGAEPLDSQRRFVHSRESFARLMEDCRGFLANLPGARLGIAPHSLRAVTPEELVDILPLAAGGPVHIHVAEQVREVEECLAWSGQRPVDWLLDHAAVDGQWTLIHATHMTDDETTRMAQRGAIAGLCPVTEANLGDGVFPAFTFLEAGGRFGVGSDSNILVSVPEELRLLEYSQRLMHRARNVIAAPGTSTGQRLFDEALRGGAKALQGNSGIGVGEAADFVSLDTLSCPHAGPDRVMDQWIFTSSVKVDCVWVRGQKCVEGGRHSGRERIFRRFSSAMRALLAGMA